MDSVQTLLADSLRRGASLDEALAELREQGAFPVAVIKAIHLVRQVSLAEAKLLFAKSPAWAVEAAAGDALHAEVASILANESGG